MKHEPDYTDYTDHTDHSDRADHSDHSDHPDQEYVRPAWQIKVMNCTVVTIDGLSHVWKLDFGLR